MNEFSFSQWLEDEIKRRGLKIRKVARMTGLTEKAIYQYLRVKRIPSIMTVVEILDAFGYRIKIVKKRGKKNECTASSESRCGANRGA